MRACIFILSCLIALPVLAEERRLSAITWGGYRMPNSLAPIDAGNGAFEATAILSGNFGWKMGRADLVPYLSYFNQSDMAGYSYNSKHIVSLGLELRYKFQQNGRLSFGARLDGDFRPLEESFNSGPILTADYSFWREKKRSNTTSTILFGWANARFPGSVQPEDASNLIVQGAVNYAIRRPIGRSKFLATGLVGLGGAFDSNQSEFNNKQFMEFGFKIERKIKQTDVIFSALYRLENRQISGDNFAGPVLGLSWLAKF